MSEPTRFCHNPQLFVGVPSEQLVFVGLADRAAFDRIGAPCQDHGETAHDHVLTKTVGEHGAREVTVVFQYWIKELTIDAIVAQKAGA